MFSLFLLHSPLILLLSLPDSITNILLYVNRLKKDFSIDNLAILIVILLLWLWFELGLWLGDRSMSKLLLLLLFVFLLHLYFDFLCLFLFILHFLLLLLPHPHEHGPSAAGIHLFHHNLLLLSFPRSRPGVIPLLLLGFVLFIIGLLFLPNDQGLFDFPAHKCDYKMPI